ncbi:DMT family transporter [Rhizobium grahamii]|uniref:EamA domain-containing protein n=1 Tax=Rhizobium grahamii CCGE 502 TaxID=990285 RepID=S3HLE0_9HYPH|nr:DMT family transporter [Rhizobium grahamii]EPE94191.1 hypothetical protein RGCCGE502_30877 [Rhizobium grahamii CCGE 502]
MNRLAASALGALGIVLWASETMLVTYTTAIPPLQTVSIAFLFAAALSPAIWLLTGSHPLQAFRQPIHVWLLSVTSLVGYHGCIYYATQKAPPAAAALLQGTTPLMIVLGSCLLPGEKLRWWHVAGVVVGLCGVLLLIDRGGEASIYEGAPFYLALIGVAAALWGLYSVLTRTLAAVPTSALGWFYAASAAVSFSAHLAFESWVRPNVAEWSAMAALGVLPMGLAIYMWDHGMKRGDIQALGAFSYVEPFIGAVLVAIFTSAVLDASLFWSGLLIVGGAALASCGLWTSGSKEKEAGLISPRNPVPGRSILQSLVEANSKHELASVNNRLLERLIEIGRDYSDPRKHDAELAELLHALGVSVAIWDQSSIETDTGEIAA